MGKSLGHLQPHRVWHYFEAICNIPRPSKHEEKILGYLVDFARSRGLEHKRDETGNLLILKPASPGFENRKTTVLQTHMDMVCEKNADASHNFLVDPIPVYIDGDWVRAAGTTLGADNGIGMAVQLAILEDRNIEHGNIECLFTVDEETGLTGATALQPEFLQGRILLNLDSEGDDELCIGCAGGVDTIATFHYERANNENEHIAYKLSISGLKGGHSGDDINKHRANANKILTRILWNCERKFDLRIGMIDGGNLRNAIAREAFAVITVPRKFQQDFEVRIGTYITEIGVEQKSNEPDLTITCHETAMPDFLIDYFTQNRLLNALYACPHGVIGMSPDISGLVETSTNLASVKMTSTDIVVSTSQRSASKTLKKDVRDMVGSLFQLAGAKVKHGEGYPGWTPDLNSDILRVARNIYHKLFGTQPKVIAIHAGLECGIIGEKYPGMDMISYGPAIKDAHSPNERLLIPTVDKFWKFTLEILKDIPEK